MINVGLIGFGFGGRVFHAPTISAVAGLTLAAILQRSGSNRLTSEKGAKILPHASKRSLHGPPARDAQMWGTESPEIIYPEARIVRSVDEMLAVPEIDLVTVTTPNHTHFEIARRCLEAGKHVVIDKPFAATLEEARELAELARQRGKVLSVYQNRRWDSDFLTVQKLAVDRALGRIILFEAHYDRFRPELRSGTWKESTQPGTGLLFDLGPHLIDQALVLFGIPEAVWADVRRERDGSQVDDAFDVIFFYPRIRAVLRSTMLAAAPGPRFAIFGDRGSFVKYGLDPQEEALIAGKRPGGADWGREDEKDFGTLTAANGEVRRVTSVAGDYRKYYENVRDAILGNAPLAVTPEQGLNVMMGIELAMESSREGRQVGWPGSEKPQVNRPEERR